MKKLIAVLVALVAVVLLGGAATYFAFVSELKHTGFPAGKNAVCTVGGGTAVVTGSGEIDIFDGFSAFTYEKAQGLNPCYRLIDRLYVNGLSVEKVTLGPEITGVYSQSFGNCHRLTEIEVDEANPYLCAVDGVLFNKEKTVLLAYPAGREDDAYTVPESVTEIGENAFYGCPYLRSVTLPQGLETIGVWAFLNCGQLVEASLPEGVKEIGVAAFSGCEALERADLPDSLVSVGSSGFYGSGLKEVSVGAGLTEAGENVFGECASLASFTVSPDNPVYASENGVLFNKEKTVLLLYPAGREDDAYTVPEGVTEIGKYAFGNAVFLKEVVFPQTLKTIGGWSFAGCSALETLTVPGSVETVGEAAFSSCEALRELTLCDGVKEIADLAFAGCLSLTEAYVPDSVTSLGGFAFGFRMEDWPPELLKGFTLRCGDNAEARRYAEENGVAYEVI